MFCEALQRKEACTVVTLVKQYHPGSQLFSVFMLGGPEREFNLYIPELFVYTIRSAWIYILREDFFFLIISLSLSGSLFCKHLGQNCF